MIDLERLDKELADYLVANALGATNVKTKDQVIESMHDRGVFGLGVSREAAVRALCESRVRLIAKDVPVGTSNDGWFVCLNLGEYNGVEVREGARATAIRVGLTDLKKACYMFWRTRIGTQEALPL